MIHAVGSMLSLPTTAKIACRGTRMLLHVRVVLRSPRNAFNPVLHCGSTGAAVPSPITVVHSRTYQRLTRPFRTYESARANASAAAGVEPWKRSTA